MEQQKLEKVIGAIWTVLLKRKLVTPHELNQIEQIVNSKGDVNEALLESIWKVLK